MDALDVDWKGHSETPMANSDLFEVYVRDQNAFGYRRCIRRILPRTYIFPPALPRLRRTSATQFTRNHSSRGARTTTSREAEPRRRCGPRRSLGPRFARFV